MPSTQPKRILITLLSLCAMIGVIWASHYLSLKKGIEDQTKSNQQQLQQFIGHLESQLARYSFIPELIAKNRLLVDLLNEPDNASRVDITNRFLEEVNRITGASDTYLMDRQGLTLSASNWLSDRPFVGRNFSFRPYFAQAMHGVQGRYFALGTTSGERGYYFAYPVTYAAEIIGALVVKMDLSKIEQRWSERVNQFVVSDLDGVIFITTQSDWLYKSLTPLADEKLEDIVNSLRYGNSHLDSIKMTEQTLVDSNNRIVSITNPSNKPVEYLSRSQLMPEAGWRVMILSPLQDIRRDSLNTVIVTLLLISTILLAAILARQRHRRRLERERFQQDAQKKLEQQVTLRTSDLRYEIEQHKKTEQMLRDTQGELIQTAKLAVLGQMSASISHELNNPLAAMRSYADNAKQFLKREQPQQVDDNLGRIVDLTERMGKISSQLKFFARKSSGNLEILKIKPLIQTAIDIVMPQYKNTTTKIDISGVEEQLQVRADSIQLEQVVINLLNNALHILNESDDGKILVHAHQHPGRCLLVIEDNGPGIDESNLERIFDPFFTTRESGLGLGLSISARIIDSMDGELSVENREQGGARFLIALPAQES